MRGLPVAAAAALLACASPPRRSRTPAPPPTPETKALLRAARAYLPEEGDRPIPVDCSDFVRKVFAERGRQLPRDARQMAALGEPVHGSSSLRMADLLFFTGSSGRGGVGHVGIYVNNGIFIHLPRPEVGVRMESLYSDYYRRRYLFARRILK